MYNVKGVAPSTYFMLCTFRWAAKVSLEIQVLFKVVLSCDSYNVESSKHQ